MVALCAAQAEQSTIELPLPPGAAEQEPYGLLTYTLAEILRTARSPLTYRELAQRIQRAYIKAGRTTPTPLLEGEGVSLLDLLLVLIVGGSIVARASRSPRPQKVGASTPARYKA